MPIDEEKITQEQINQFEQETGKNAYWRGSITKNFTNWLEEQTSPEPAKKEPIDPEHKTYIKRDASKTTKPITPDPENHIKPITKIKVIDDKDKEQEIKIGGIEEYLKKNHPLEPLTDAELEVYELTTEEKKSKQITEIPTIEKVITQQFPLTKELTPKLELKTGPEQQVAVDQFETFLKFITDKIKESGLGLESKNIKTYYKAFFNLLKSDKGISPQIENFKINENNVYFKDLGINIEGFFEKAAEYAGLKDAITKNRFGWLTLKNHEDAERLEKVADEAFYYIFENGSIDGFIRSNNPLELLLNKIKSKKMAKDLFSNEENTGLLDCLYKNFLGNLSVIKTNYLKRNNGDSGQLIIDPKEVGFTYKEVFEQLIDYAGIDEEIIQEQGVLRLKNRTNKKVLYDISIRAYAYWKNHPQLGLKGFKYEPDQDFDFEEEMDEDEMDFFNALKDVATAKKRKQEVRDLKVAVTIEREKHLLQSIENDIEIIQMYNDQMKNELSEEIKYKLASFNGLKDFYDENGLKLKNKLDRLNKEYDQLLVFYKSFINKMKSIM